MSCLYSLMVGYLIFILQLKWTCFREYVSLVKLGLFCLDGSYLEPVLVVVVGVEVVVVVAAVVVVVEVVAAAVVEVVVAAALVVVIVVAAVMK